MAEIRTDDRREMDELTEGERERLRTETEREIDDVDAIPGPDQNVNQQLENLPEEIEEANEHYDMDPTTMQAEFSIFKLAALIAAVVIAILLIVAVIWIF